MHTIGKDSDGTWWVGRVEQEQGQSNIFLLFKGVSFGDALALCCCLNGGASIDNEHFMKAAERCAT